MSDSDCQVRRATVDDLPELRGLWAQAQLPVEALEKRIREFQIIEGPDQALLGAAGLTITSQQGRIFGEAYAFPDKAEFLRPKLLERFLVVSRNHGLARLWIDDLAWTSLGFKEDLGPGVKRPVEFTGDTWCVFPLREESARTADLEQEFEIFKQAQQAESERALQRARTLRLFAWLLAVVLILLVLGLGFYVLRNLPAAGRP
jgi:N-acetylglutamate synthase-like GNAT family acetyltransferase